MNAPDLPADLRQSLPRYPIPAILIAKLAVDRSMQGRGLGKQLLFHALARAIDVYRIVGVYGVRVDAIDENAKGEHPDFASIQKYDKMRCFWEKPTLSFLQKYV